MSDLRAEILQTGDQNLRSARIMIAAPAAKIFEVLAQPSLHSKVDGSNTVKGLNWGPARLTLSAKFGMQMKIGFSYKITNVVVEFEEGRRLAWRHLGRWVWRYELLSDGPEKTIVTESFDGRPSPFKWWLRVRNSYSYSEKWMGKTLVRLKHYIENSNRE